LIKLDTKVTNNISNYIKDIKKDLAKIPQEAHKEFVQLTPIDKGNARKRTTLNKDVITANYPYAQRLDEGYSKQAPKGMVKPLEKWLEKRLAKVGK
jgi:hypothetical protein